MTTKTMKAPKSKPATPQKARRPGELPANLPESAAVDMATQKIDLERLTFDDQPDRLDELLDKDAIAGLAESMARNGQLHPIGVTAMGKPGEYRVVFGRRRVLAARQLGWKAIAATVRDYADETEILEAREIENVQRQELNPVEEAAAVARLLDMHTGKIPAAERTTISGVISANWAALSKELRVRVVDTVAEQLGKSRTWVRDREFLARMSGKARRFVLESKLPLGHAREIAKVADPTVRDDLAQQIVDAEGALAIEDVRDLVSKHLYSLAVVPWRLDHAFIGKPACVECRHNSANNPGLFDHATQFALDPKEARSGYVGEKREPEAGVCTLKSCYEEKSAATNKAVATAARTIAKKVLEQPRTNRERHKAAGISEKSPAFVKPKVVEEQVEARLKPEKKEPTTRDKPARKPAGLEEYEIKNRYRDSCRARLKDLAPEIAKGLAKRPGAWALLMLAKASKPWQKLCSVDPAESQKNRNHPALRAIVAAIANPTWEHLLGVEKECGRNFGLFDEWREGPSCVDLLVAEALGIDCSAHPFVSYADFAATQKREHKAKAGA
ncbi:MAG: ParB/RepB/Spo0J family partition protein [Planctomycetota bacterium]|nr:ParB/RepB/Spo0J family partition protein [Planctomycetota bacterium]